MVHKGDAGRFDCQGGKVDFGGGSFRGELLGVYFGAGVPLCGGGDAFHLCVCEQEEGLRLGRGGLNCLTVLVKFWMLPSGVPPHLTLEKYMSSLFVPSASMLGLE